MDSTVFVQHSPEEAGTAGVSGRGRSSLESVTWRRVWRDNKAIRKKEDNREASACLFSLEWPYKRISSIELMGLNVKRHTHIHFHLALNSQLTSFTHGMVLAVSFCGVASLEMDLPVLCIQGICLSDVGFLKPCQQTGLKSTRSLWKSPQGLMGKWERKPKRKERRCEKRKGKNAIWIGMIWC